VHDCGYVSTKKDGAERLQFTTFYEALLEAKGINPGVGASEEDENCSLRFFKMAHAFMSFKARGQECAERSQSEAARNSRQKRAASAAISPDGAAAIRFTKALPTMAPSAPQLRT